MCLPAYSARCLLGRVFSRRPKPGALPNAGESTPVRSLSGSSGPLSPGVLAITRPFTVHFGTTPLLVFLQARKAGGVLEGVGRIPDVCGSQSLPRGCARSQIRYEVQCLLEYSHCAFPSPTAWPSPAAATRVWPTQSSWAHCLPRI